MLAPFVNPGQCFYREALTASLGESLPPNERKNTMCRKVTKRLTEPPVNIAQIIENHSNPRALRAFIAERAPQIQRTRKINGNVITERGVDWRSVDIEKEVSEFASLFVGWFSSSEEYIRGLPGISQVSPTLLKRMDFDYMVDRMDSCGDIRVISGIGQDFWVFDSW
jgi:hypothetical protein